MPSHDPNWHPIRQLRHADWVPVAKAIVDLDVATVRPPEILESLPEGRQLRLYFRSALGDRHQHANSPYSLGLLRTRGERVAPPSNLMNSRRLIRAPHLQ